MADKLQHQLTFIMSEEKRRVIREREVEDEEEEERGGRGEKKVIFHKVTGSRQRLLEGFTLTWLQPCWVMIS